jgi:hypothetical protein
MVAGVSPLQIIQPGGKITGKYYMTPPTSIRTSRESETTQILIDKEILTSTIAALLKLKEIEDHLIPAIENESRTHKTFASEFLPTSLGNSLTLLGADTATQSAINCTTMGGHIYDIKNAADVKVIKEMAAGILAELGESKTEAVGGFNDFWQEIMLSQEKLPKFLRTGNPIPLKIGNKGVTASLGELTSNTKCAFFSITGNSYSQALCQDPGVKKHVACALNDIGSKRFTFHIANHLRKTLSFLGSAIPALFDDLKHPKPTTNLDKGIPTSIFDKNETKIVKAIRTLVANTVSYNTFMSLTNFNKILVNNLQKFYNALRTKDISAILPILTALSPSTLTSTAMKSLHTRQTIATEIYTTATQVVIDILTASDTQLMTSASLHPMIFNKKQPQFSGQILKTTTECIHNDCNHNPCHIEVITPISCCKANILGLEGHCPNIESTTLKYLARVEKNKYLLVSSSDALISSHTCPNIQAKVKGSVLITIVPQTTGCDIQIENVSLPILGTISAEIYTSPTTRSPINLIKNQLSNFPNIQSAYTEYLLPITVVLGTLATVIGTAITVYIFFKKHLSNPEDPDDLYANQNANHPSESYPLQTILKPFPRVSNMLTYSEGSDTSSHS